MKTYFVAGGLAVLVILVAFSFSKPETRSLSGQGSKIADICRVYSQSVVRVGHQLSTQVLAASSTRAFARITLPVLNTGVATNTGYVSFGGTATLENVPRLATSSLSLDLGRNTDLPYVGAVSILTNTASTTVHVFECAY